jgi:aspartate/methionine/tyrosine aminotransferase
VTPDFIRQAAIDSLHHGETFYAHNLGLPYLREGLAGGIRTAWRSPAVASTR